MSAQLLQVKRDTSISCNINIEALQSSNYVTLKCLSLSTCNICGNNVGSVSKAVVRQGQRPNPNHGSGGLVYYRDCYSTSCGEMF